MALEPLSLRAYAAHRRSLGLPGGSLPAVRKAINTERLKDSVVTVAGIKKISDPEFADREWLANTDPTKALIGFLDEDGEDEKSASPMVLAAAREKHWKAQRAELEFRKLAGELVEASEVQAEFVALCTSVRNKLLGLPNRMKQAHPELTLEQLATMDGCVRESLEELGAEPTEDTA